MYPPSPISNSFVEQYKDKTPPWGFNGLGYITYKRTYARPILDENGNPTHQTEEWWQTLQRVVNGAQAIGAQFTQDEAERLYDYMFNLKGLVGGRMLWQLGTPNNTRIGMASLVNCYYCELASIEDFGWLLERLMLGGGVGFSVDKPERLGVPAPGKVEHVDHADCDYIVPDNREGWAEVVMRAMRTYLDPSTKNTLRYSTQLIRPYGTPIKTFGGVASGPEILIEGIEKITDILDQAVGRHLRSTEVLDMANIIGQIVVAGNVRRSAEIALGNPFDRDFLEAKNWQKGNIPVWRAMSNNSVYMKPDGFQQLLTDHETFVADRPEDSTAKSAWETLWDGYNGNGEPYGFFNLETSQTYGRIGETMPDMTITGTNPCAEIGLAHRESCNLSEIFLPNLESQTEFADLAKLLYKVQKAIAALPDPDRGTDEITSKNMRLGLGVTGIAQAMDKLDWLDPTYRELRQFDAEWSAQHGWPNSIRLTTVKPSGTLSLLAGTTAGVHPGFSRFHVRRVRMSAGNPLVEFCRNHGYPVEPDVTDPERTMIVEFPVEFSPDTLFAEDMTAIDMLGLVRRVQREWADNAVSVSVYYSKDELPAIQEYLLENWSEMKSVSFMLHHHNDHGFAQPPLEEITEEEYRERLLVVVKDGAQVGGEVGELLDSDCVAGACPIR